MLIIEILNILLSPNLPNNSDIQLYLINKSDILTLSDQDEHLLLSRWTLFGDRHKNKKSPKNEIIAKNYQNNNGKYSIIALESREKGIINIEKH